MKQFFVTVAIIGMAMTAYSRADFDSCGLGWEVTSKKTVFATSTRGTTNSFVPPTFGMTSGTIGCDQFNGIVMAEKSGAEYVAQNYETIRAELATGQGEYVDATAQSFNCDSQSFGEHVQKNYDGVVAPTSNGIELYNSLKAVATKVCS